MYRYERVVEQIKLAIAGGQLVSGTKIPSLREYAVTHGISVNTVKTAYRLLEDQGVIIASPKSGYFVAPSSPAPADMTTSKTQDNMLPLSGINRLLDDLVQAQQEKNYIDLAIACPAGEQFYPTRRLRKVLARVLRSRHHSQDRYALPPGSARLRTQIARRGVNLGMLLSPKDIIITHGAMEGLSIAVRACTLPGDCIALETPTFYNVYPMLEELGRKIISIPTHPRNGMCLDSLAKALSEKNIKAVITVPSGQNPLGFTMPVENRKRLAEMASEKKIAVIEDAIYAELQYGDSFKPNIKSFDTDGWVITCSSYTKTLSPDFRIGWLEGGRFKVKARQIKFTSTVAEPELLCETLGVFLENGSYDLHLRHLRRIYSAQTDAVTKAIFRYFPEHTQVSRPECGFILWVTLPVEIDTLKLFHTALDAGIICMPGLLCSGNYAFNNCLRIAVCFDLSEKYLWALKRLGELAHEQILLTSNKETN